jgi:hypothetical protein
MDADRFFDVRTIERLSEAIVGVVIKPPGRIVLKPSPAFNLSDTCLNTYMIVGERDDRQTFKPKFTRSKAWDA